MHGDFLKRGIKNVIMAAQRQTLHTKTIASNEYHATDDPICRLCKEKPGIFTYVINAGINRLQNTTGLSLL